MLNIAAFGSGRGSNFEAIVTAIQQRAIRGARICLVVSNNSNAGILEIARANALPTAHLSQKQFANETQFVDRLLDTLKIHGTNFILLVGYMKQLHPRVIQTYRNRIISIHPALLPKYGGKGMYGASVHEAVIAAREKFSGATVHVVDEEYDRGPIVLQNKVAVAPDDTPETLAAKVLAVEHEIYPAAVRLFAEGKIVVKDDEIAVYHS